MEHLYISDWILDSLKVLKIHIFQPLRLRLINLVVEIFAPLFAMAPSDNRIVVPHRSVFALDEVERATHVAAALYLICEMRKIIHEI